MLCRVYKRDKQEPLVTDMVQCGMAVSGYPNMENIPPAHNYTAPPRVVVPPLQQQQNYSPVQSLSPNYPPPVSPNLAAVFPQPRAAAVAGGRPVMNSAGPSGPLETWSNGNSAPNAFGSQVCSLFMQVSNNIINSKVIGYYHWYIFNNYQYRMLQKSY